MGGALLAHTMAGLLDGRRQLGHPPTSFAPLSVDANGALSLRPFYRTVVSGKRVLIADDVRNTGKTFERAKAILEEAGARVIATVADLRPARSRSSTLGVPNIALAEYRRARELRRRLSVRCAGRAMPVTRF